MDLALLINGIKVSNARWEYGDVIADFPDVLTLTRGDMVNVRDVRVTDSGHTGELVLTMGDVSVRLQYPVPPRTRCVRCNTLHYEDSVKYCGGAECLDNPELEQYRYKHVCLSCIGILLDESVTRHCARCGEPIAGDLDTHLVGCVNR